jgi:hypothetical protein
VQEDDIKEAQRAFFRKNKAGCAFAAYAAKGVGKYGWEVVVLPVSAAAIGEELTKAIGDPGVQALSMIFPDVSSASGIKDLVSACVDSGHFVEQGHNTESTKHVRLRAYVGSDVSWVTGFGPFDFLPPTRRAQYCELTIRVKPRPAYDWYFKEPQEGIIHLADLDMRGLRCEQLWKLWGVSFATTKRILGHAPDEESAAKTTFVLPLAKI